MEMEGSVDAAELSERVRSLADLSQTSTHDLLSLMRYRVKANEAMDERLKVGFVVTDRDESFTLELRHGILDVRVEPSPADLDAKIALDRDTLEKLFAGNVSFLREQFSGGLEVNGLLVLRRFFGYIEQGLAPVTLADH